MEHWPWSSHRSLQERLAQVGPGEQSWCFEHVTVMIVMTVTMLVAMAKMMTIVTMMTVEVDEDPAR